MDAHIYYLFKRYEEFIEKDFIDPNKIYLNDSLFFEYCLEKLQMLLTEKSNYSNNTYKYIQGIYYNYIGNNKAMINLYSNNEHNGQSPYIYAQLGIYYDRNEKKTLARKYYKMAVKMNSTYAMRLLAIHYRNNKEYDKMKKYLNMAINLHDEEAMYLFGEYYRYSEDNKEMWEKYILMTVNNGCNRFIDRLCYYYKTNGRYTEFTDLCVLSINVGNYYSHNVGIMLRDYCNVIEKNPSNYNKYVYYPRFLTLIICLKKYNTKNKMHATRNIFLPEEVLYYLIFKEHIL